VLAREAGLRQILGRGARPDSDRTPEPLVGLGDLAAKVVRELAVRRGRDAETIGHPLARLDHLTEVRGLAADERDAAGVDVGERDDSPFASRGA
jgi:hypothetical protein